jgi:tetratricopeptide (TPR) repeat protein
MSESFPYSIDYEDMVVEVLRTTGGRHLHIGELSDELRKRIAARLVGAGIDLQNFQYLPFAPNLSLAFKQFDVGAYLGSMPRGGGRASVEAMGSGLPIIIHSNYRSRFLSDENEVYPEAFVWRTFDELRNALASLDAAAIKVHSNFSRRHYEAHHRPALLQAAIRATIAGKRPLPPPAGARYPTDELQTFFDERHGYETFSASFAERQGPWAETCDPLLQLVDPVPAPESATMPAIVAVGGGTDDGDDDDDSLEQSLASAAEQRRRTYVLKLAQARAKARLSSERVRAADQAFPAAVFTKLVAQRFDSGLGSDAAFGTRTFITFAERPEGVAIRDSGRVHTEAREQLFLADVMKAQGFFADAEDIYREIANSPGAKAPALRGLGDLLLTLATWSDEFNAYGWDGRALNPYAKLTEFKGRKTWHSAQLNDAIKCLEQAVKAEPDHPDGLWLLTIAHLKAGQWAQAEKLAKRYAAEVPDAPDSNALILRASFGVNERKCIARARDMFAGWRDPLGRRCITMSAIIAPA